MKYLALDTNIYLDMVVSRDRTHESDSYNQMEKLLDYGEIKLIVPAIVITEINRNLNNEIEKVFQHLKSIKKSVNELYWINNVEEMKIFKENVPSVQEQIKKLHRLYEENKNQYLIDAQNLFEKLFIHKNVIIIEENQEIIFKANQREIHKKRPFHYNQKDSIADAVIIETLVNIKKVIPTFSTEDNLYFITRNYKDFSSEKNKEELHSDIQKSIQTVNFSEQFNYRVFFSKTLLEDFKEEAEHVGVLEELQLERDRELIEDLKYEEIESSRQAGGLSSLYLDWEEKISELTELQEMMSIFNRYTDTLTGNFESFAEDYFEIIEKIEKINHTGLISTVNNFNKVEPGIFSLNGTAEEMRDEILELLTDRISINPEYFDSDEMWNSEEVFQSSTNLLTFKNFDEKNYEISVDGELNPENGGSDSLVIKYEDEIKGSMNYENGVIDINYGYLNFNEDGNAADGEQEDIQIFLDDILNATEEIFDYINNQIQKEHQNLQYLRKSLRV